MVNGIWPLREVLRGNLLLIGLLSGIPLARNGLSENPSVTEVLRGNLPVTEVLSRNPLREVLSGWKYTC